MDFIGVFDRPLHNLQSYPPPNLSFLEAVAVFDRARHELTRDDDNISTEELENLNVTEYGSEGDIFYEALENGEGVMRDQLVAVRLNQLCNSVFIGLEDLIPAAKEKLKSTGENPVLKNALPTLISHYEEYLAQYNKKNWKFHKEKPYIVQTVEDAYFKEYIAQQVTATPKETVQVKKRKKTPSKKNNTKSKKKKSQDPSGDTTMAKEKSSSSDEKILWDYDKNCELIRLVKQKKAELGNNKFIKAGSYAQIADDMRKRFKNVRFTDDKCRSAYSRQLAMYIAYKKVDTASGIGNTNEIGVVKDFCKQNKLYEKFFDMVTGDRYPMHETFPTYNLMFDCVGDHHFTGDRMMSAEMFMGALTTDVEATNSLGPDIEDEDVLMTSTTSSTSASSHHSTSSSPSPPAFPQVAFAKTATASSPPPSQHQPIKGKKTSMLQVAEHLGSALDSFANTFATTVSSAVQVLSMPVPKEDSAVQTALRCLTEKDTYPLLHQCLEDKTNRIKVEDYLCVEANAAKFLAVCVHNSCSGDDDNRMINYVNDRIFSV